jgi:hypothetical protein
MKPATQLNNYRFGSSSVVAVEERLRLMTKNSYHSKTESNMWLYVITQSESPDIIFLIYFFEGHRFLSDTQNVLLRSLNEVVCFYTWEESLAYRYSSVRSKPSMNTVHLYV